MATPRFDILAIVPGPVDTCLLIAGTNRRVAQFS